MMKKISTLLVVGIFGAGLWRAPVDCADEGGILGTMQKSLDKAQQGADTLKQGQEIMKQPGGQATQAKEAAEAAVQEKAEEGKAAATDAAAEATGKGVETLHEGMMKPLGGTPK